MREIHIGMPVIFGLMLLLSSCSATPMPPLTQEHPASPTAAEAPLPALSGTLDLAEGSIHTSQDTKDAEDTGHQHAHSARPGAETRQATKQAGADTSVFTCSMHPDVTSDKPGRCPECGMKLIIKDQNHSDHGEHK